MYNEYLRAFVIGSSFIVFAPFFYIIFRLDPKLKNYTNTEYSFIAPLGLGLINVISLMIANVFCLSRRMRYLVASLLVPISLISIAYCLKLYNFSKKSWAGYGMNVFLIYFLVLNGIMYFLDNYV